MSRLMRILTIVTILAMLGGCASFTSSRAPAGQDKQAVAEPADQKPAQAPDKEENPELERAKEDNERAKLVRDLAVAERKLVKARLDLEQQQAKDQAAEQAAAAELDIARRKLQNLTDKEAPVRLDQGKLEVKAAQDSLLEAKEELDQLQMMYGEDELADKTAEIVIQRAKRRIARQEWRLRISEQELKNLEQETLPIEEQDLRHDVESKDEALKEAQRTAEANKLDKGIDITSAEGEIADLNAQIAELDLEKKLKEAD